MVCRAPDKNLQKNIIKFEVNEQKYIWNGTALISVDTAVQIISYESE